LFSPFHRVAHEACHASTQNGSKKQRILGHPPPQAMYVSAKLDFELALGSTLSPKQVTLFC
jgi:hypothetical protein